MKKLKKYRVLLSAQCGAWVTLEAESEDEAVCRAEEGYYDSVDREEVKPNSPRVELVSEEPYSTDQVLDFIRDHCIQWEMIGFPEDDDARIEFHNYENSTKYCDYPYDNRNSVIEGIWFIMDMHHKSEDKLNVCT